MEWGFESWGLVHFRASKLRDLGIWGQLLGRLNVYNFYCI